MSFLRYGQTIATIARIVKISMVRRRKFRTTSYQRNLSNCGNRLTASLDVSFELHRTATRENWIKFVAFVNLFSFLQYICVFRCDNTSHHGHTNVRYKCITSTGFIYKSYRRMDRRLFDIRVWCAAGICTCQLCIALRLDQYF